MLQDHLNQQTIPALDAVAPTLRRLPIKVVYAANYFDMGRRDRGPSGDYFEVYSSGNGNSTSVLHNLFILKHG